MQFLLSQTFAASTQVVTDSLEFATGLWLLCFSLKALLQLQADGTAGCGGDPHGGGEQRSRG